jgi:hypothetical protein
VRQTSMVRLSLRNIVTYSAVIDLGCDDLPVRAPEPGFLGSVVCVMREGLS